MRSVIDILDLSLEEIDSLMRKLLILENPFVGINGKTIAIKFLVC